MQKKRSYATKIVNQNTKTLHFVGIGDIRKQLYRTSPVLLTA